MAGGLLNIVSEGNNNVILTGSPTKTFFKVAYSKYTNFGLQKFRLDYDGTRDLRLTDESVFKFKVKRYSELLMDTYIVVTLPDIWSPIYQPRFVSADGINGRWAPYDFRWIKNIGTHIIKDVHITCGAMTLQRYSGDYLAAMVDRDFSSEKKDLFNEMTGNVDVLNNPAAALGRANCYPSAYYQSSQSGAEPSIRGRTLYIPINTWFSLDSRCAFPLVALQYNELEITVTMRSIQDLFQVRDVYDSENNFPYVRPDFNETRFQMYRYLQTPPHVLMDEVYYENKISTWNADVHLLATYCFLSKEERQVFAAKEQLYLIKDVHKYEFENVTGSKRLKLTSSSGMVANWMFYMQRNDVNMRNEWSNYTNWPYKNPPNDILEAPGDFDTNFPQGIKDSIAGINLLKGPKEHPTGQTTGYFISGVYSVENRKEILETMGIVLNGEYRENMMPRGVFDYVEKYTRTQGHAHEGLYCYNFCLNTNPLEYQPSGAINMSKFNNIELEITTYVPQYAPTSESSYDVICDSDGNPIGVKKQNWRLFDYNYNLVLFEERYNVLSFQGGNCGLLYAR